MILLDKTNKKYKYPAVAWGTVVLAGCTWGHYSSDSSAVVSAVAPVDFGCVSASPFVVARPVVSSE